MIIKKDAYVLIFSLAIMSVVSVLTFQLMRMAYVGYHFDKTMIDRERAEMLALGGVNLAMVQLTVKESKKDKKTQTSNDKQKTGIIGLLNRVLPLLNRWQKFNLVQDIDGIDGQMKLCISCEDGKINLNEAFEFNKKEFKQQYKDILGSLYFKGQENTKGEILKRLTEYFKKRGRPIDDISQLHSGAIPQIRTLFYQPPDIPKRRRDAKPNTDLALMDIFTIWSSSDQMEGLLLSDSVSAVFGLRRPRAYDEVVRKKQTKEVIENFKKDQDQNTKEYWNSVKPLYEQGSDSTIWEKKVFSSKFEPKVYSVLSSGKVGDVEQRLLAIIEKSDLPTKSTKDQGKKKERGKKQIPQPFKILRMYWI